MDELLQKHRAFALSVLVGGFVFLVALMVRGCGVYTVDLKQRRTEVVAQGRAITATPVPNDDRLRALEGLVKTAEEKVAALANMTGHTLVGEALQEECITAILGVIGAATPDKVADYRDLARRLPNVCLSNLVGEVGRVLQSRAAQNGVEVAEDNLGLQGATFQAEDLDRNLAGLAIITRVVDRAIQAGVLRIDSIVPGGSVRTAGGNQSQPFVRSYTVQFKMRGDAAALTDVLRSLNERDREGKGRRVVLEELSSLGRTTGVRAGEPVELVFRARLLLVNLEAKEEESR